MTITLIKPCTNLVWRSPTPGNKTVSIPGSDDANNGYTLDIITTFGTNENYTVTPTSGTIGGASSYIFQDEPCTLTLVSDAENNDWVIKCLCCGNFAVPLTALMATYPGYTGSTNNTYLEISGALSGVADSSKGTFSIWTTAAQPGSGFRGDGSNILYLQGTSGLGLLAIDFSKNIPFNFPSFGFRAGNTSLFSGNVLGKDTTLFDVPISPSGIYHILFSFDVGFSAGSRQTQLYINDVNYTLSTSYLDSGGPITIPYTASTYFRLFNQYGSSHASSAGSRNLYDIWFQPGLQIDFSVEANRRLFDRISTNSIGIGVIDLGSNGQTPTGTSPAVFNHIGIPPAPGTDFQVNLGTGGTFVLGGTNPIPFTTDGPPPF